MGSTLGSGYTPLGSALTNAQLLVILIVVGIAIKRRYFSSISDIPGPFWASISSFWQIYHLFKGHTEVEVIALHRKHGDFVRIADNEVSVAHVDAPKLLLLAQIPKGTWYSIFSLPDYNYVNVMSEIDPKKHIQRMKNLSAGYSLSNVIKSEPYVDAALDLFEQRLDALSQAGLPIEWDKWFNYFAFDVLGEVTFSKSFGFLQEGRDIRNAISNTRALALYIAVMGHFVWLHQLTLGNPLLSRLGIQPSSHIFDTCLAAIDARSNNPEVRKDMLEEWLNVRRRYPDRMSQNDVLAAAAANIGAGADTVSATLQAFVYYLLRNAAAYQKLRKELDDAYRRGQLSKTVQYAEAMKLPYLQACIKETYRYHTAVGTGLPRVVPEGGLSIGGRHFKQGTVLSINPWVFHRNPAIFGADCDSFNPDRWLVDEKSFREMDRYLLHWGAGYNQCPGRHLAQFEISKVAATLFRDYDVEQVDPKANWHCETHFTAVPYDWPCRVTRRDLAEVL